MGEKIWIVPTREIPVLGPDGKPTKDADGKPVLHGPVLREVIDAREACRARVVDGEQVPADWAFAPGSAQALSDPDEVADEASKVAADAAKRRAKAREAAKQPAAPAS